jgi:hypothetical protein
VFTSFSSGSGCHVNEIYATEKINETIFTAISGDHGAKQEGRGFGHEGDENACVMWRVCGVFGLIRGRMGSPGRVRIDLCESLDDARKAFDRKLAEKKRG